MANVEKDGVTATVLSKRFIGAVAAASCYMYF